MSKGKTTERVSFITTEDGDDLIMSFAIIPGANLFNVKSLTLLRTPKYEFIPDDAERGVNVSRDKDDYLEAIQVGKISTKT